MSQIHDILKQHWGYDEFRPLQEDIINSILNQQDTLALLPTGGGKSICFQVPAMALEGICIVVSPLIALMKDQVENLNKRDIPAVAIFSGMNRKQIIFELDNCVNGRYKFLYLSPERLKTTVFQDRLPHLKVSFLAIDEAHCISQWGYDFRPEYLQIAEIRPKIEKPVLALTATATATVVKDIQEKLEFKQERVFRKSFERKNLSYVVLNEENKLGRILKICNRLKGTGIVYARNRRLCKEIAMFLHQNGHKADFYHAGLTNTERSAKQEAWIKGKSRIMVATNAFGMGIDKADVRFVIHYEMPDSLEAYYQEAGRAGRDEQKSWCILLYMERDKEEAEKRLKSNFPELDQIKRIYDLLYSHFQIAVMAGEGVTVDFDLKDFSTKYKLNPSDTFRTLKILEQHGFFSMSEALYQPSAMMVLVDNNVLYDFELRNPGIAPLVKLILRTYGGMFENYVSISEDYLARKLNAKSADIIKALQRLSQFELIDYQPAADKPRITFLANRESHLQLNAKFLREREAEARKKLEAVFEYAGDENRCRSQMLMEYFDDKSTERCGQCDTCLALKKQELEEDEFLYYRNFIKSALSKDICTVQSITAQMGTAHEPKILSAIRVLLDEGWLKYDKQGQLLWVEG